MKKCVLMFGLFILTLVLAVLSNGKERHHVVKEMVKARESGENLAFGESQADSMEIEQH